jgi:hypothetical protein
MQKKSCWLIGCLASAVTATVSRFTIGPQNSMSAIHASSPESWSIRFCTISPDVTSVEREPTPVRQWQFAPRRLNSQAVPCQNLSIPNLWRSHLTTNPLNGKVVGDSWIDRRTILRRNGSYVVPPLRNFRAMGRIVLRPLLEGEGGVR